MNSNNVVIQYLLKEGYNVSVDYYNNVTIWNAWYKNMVEDFHKYHDQNGIMRELYRLGMAKRVSEDWSSILYTERDEILCDNEANQEYLHEQLERLHFNDIASENIEKAMWSGTCGTITRINNAKLINGVLVGDDKTTFDLVNVDASKIIPLKVEHGVVIDCAFVSQVRIERNKCYYIEIHKLEEDGYVIKNVYINEKGKEVTKNGVLKEYKTYSKYPLFNLLKPKIVNNIDEDNGLGLSVYANSLDQLKACDIAYNNFIQDFALGGKKVFYNKKLVKYETRTYKDSTGATKTIEVPIYPDDLTKQQFMIVGDEADNVNESPLIKEYNPDLRIEDNEKGIDFALNVLSFTCGLGKNRYKFEGGTVLTATQYIGENQDLVVNAKKHRASLKTYCEGIARSILLLGRLLFNNGVDENDHIELTDKDGFMVSDEELQQQYREDFKAGLMSKVTYLMKARGMSEEQARKELALAEEDNPTLDSLIGE